MIFPADEGTDRQIVDRLRDEGHFVQYVAEMDPGISDDSVLEWANTQNTLLLTADKDFGELVFREEMGGAFSVIARSGARIRRKM